MYRSLDADPGSVRRARRLVALVAGLSPGVRRDAAAIVSELVTNALTHPGPRPGRRIEVRLTLESARLRIEVADHGGFPNRGSPPPSGSEPRLGLRIVTQLALHWHASDGVVTAWVAA